MALDFTGLNKIALKGFETAEEQETRDSLLQAGYTFVDAPDNPFTAPQTSVPVPPPSGGKGAPLSDHSGSRDYKRMYRAAHDFHQRHTPPHVEREYWRTHRPGEDEPPETELRYWTETAEDVGKTSAAGGNDPFLMDLLTAVMSEIEREYNAIREEAAGASESLRRAAPEPPEG